MFKKTSPKNTNPPATLARGNVWETKFDGITNVTYISQLCNIL